MNLYEKSASALSRMLANKECSAREVLLSVQGRIQSTEAGVNAYITTTPEIALAAADAVDQRRAKGEALSPLAGIPLGIKDNIVQKGVRTTCASKMLHNFVPPYSASVVERLLAEGMVPLGKLNMDEFAMGSSTETSYFKKTANPYDLTRVPGGSSGGSAASVAAMSATVALGSDTGGSIRQPAAYCGVVGVKPTYGAVSRYGLVAFASSLDQIGPIARTVEDAALLLDAICFHDKRDATSLPMERAATVGALEGGVKGLRIGIPAEYFGAGVREDIKALVQKRAKELEEAGATLCPVSLPGTKYALSAYYVISSAEASSNLARFDGVKYGYRAEGVNTLEELYLRSRTEGFGDEVLRRIMLGTFVLSSGYFDAFYKKARAYQEALKDEFAAAFQKCDLLLTPTAPDTAFPFGAHDADPLVMYASDVCTVPVNIAGLPSVSVPAGFDGDGMPVGLQLIGPRLSEGLLLRVAKSIETITGGFIAPKLG